MTMRTILDTARAEAERRYPFPATYNREWETLARERDAFVAGWEAALASREAETPPEAEADPDTGVPNHENRSTT